MPVEFVKSAEPIPGYKLLEPLGRGGFGEVWKVEAPGGLLKAMKLVYGTLKSGAGGEEVLVLEELKALDRVKTVRHPYILAIDRYDIIDGQLVIVMELADKNLWDRFKECQAQKQKGIAREELLDYLDEAAEALDLMNHQYGLTHSDIKPQNLFLVHSHIKVADFGLVKDLKDHKVLVSGFFSPIYAAPEAFEGKVNPNSDQYSLAIVYQELLTATRPFDGTNARQLLMQHMRQAPNLTSLPPKDQPVILKALSKVPAERFTSCEELVKALRLAAAPASTSESKTNTIILTKGPAPDPITGRSTIKIGCPYCQYTGRVPKKYLGQKVKCPECTRRFIVTSSLSPSSAEPAKLPSPAPPPSPASTSPSKPTPLPGTLERPSIETVKAKVDVECPVCSYKERVPKDYAGRHLTCPQCGCVYT